MRITEKFIDFWCVLVTIVVRAGVPTFLNSRASPRSIRTLQIHPHRLAPGVGIPYSGINFTRWFQGQLLLQNRGNHSCSQALHKIGTTISLAPPGYPLLCRCTKSATPSKYWWQLIINLSPAWSGLTNSYTHHLLGVVCCMRHQLSLLSTTRSSLTRIVSATRSTSCPTPTEATSLAQHRVQPPKRVFWSRTASFLSVFSTQIDSWTAFKIPTFPAEIQTLIKHVPPLMFSSVKRSLPR